MRYVLIVGFSVVIAFLGIVVFILEATVITRSTVEQAQQKVRNDLNTARSVVLWKIESVRTAARFAASRTFVAALLRGAGERALVERLDHVRREERLDILTVADAQGRVVVRARNPTVRGTLNVRDTIVRQTLHERRSVAGIVSEPLRELALEGEDLAARAGMKPQVDSSIPGGAVSASAGMLIKAAAPVMDGGRVRGVVYAAVLLNNDETLVDRIKETVFQGMRFRGRDIGTATIFLGDRRIATNVLLPTGERAVGTQMSADVRTQVIDRGEPWIDRALVLDEWYITAYEPIRDPDGAVIGALYVGMREAPFLARRNTLLMQLGLSVVLALLVVAAAGAWLATMITRPMDRLMQAVGRIAAGDFSEQVHCGALSAELNDLITAFNRMSAELEHMTLQLRETNQQLTETNRTYLKLLGIVSHEFKGALSSLIMNACSVKDGYLGPVTVRQRRALESMEATLDRLTEMVRHYLDLSRLERDELALKPAVVDICTQVIVPSVDVFRTSPRGMQMQWDVQLPPAFLVWGDRVLLSTVMDNLLSNAVKYGSENGVVRVSADIAADGVTVRVFNTGTPIPAESVPRLFRKFSRLHDENERRARGTGLGLYIAAQIVARHGGTIRCEPAADGNTFVFTLPAAGDRPTVRSGGAPREAADTDR